MWRSTTTQSLQLLELCGDTDMLTGSSDRQSLASGFVLVFCQMQSDRLTHLMVQ